MARQSKNNILSWKTNFKMRELNCLVYMLVTYIVVFSFPDEGKDNVKLGHQNTFE